MAAVTLPGVIYSAKIINPKQITTKKETVDMVPEV